MTEYKKLREEYREQRRAGTLKRRFGLPIGSNYLAKKDPEYRGFLRLERAKERDLRRESLFKKKDEYNLKKSPEYRAFKRKERELRMEERKKKWEKKNKEKQ